MNQTDWIVNEIKHVCQIYKSRVAGSESERACSDYLGNLLSNWADDVKTEEFTVHPHAFIGSIPLQSILAICSILSYWLSAWLSSRWFSVLCTFFALLALLSWTFEHALYRKLTDVFWPKAVSKNVMAVRKARGETKRRIILCGHADAAFELPFILKFKMPLIVALIVLADMALLFCVVSSIIQLFIASNTVLWMTLGIVDAAGLIVILPFVFFVNWKVVADGANDNLSSDYIFMSILKEMEERSERFEHTDVCCLITGGEESGLRGSFAYARAHKKELLETDTVVIAADTIHEISQLMVYTRGINGTQKNDPEACELLRQAGRNCGVSLPDAGFYTGATDAEGFSRYGIKAAAICGVRHTPMPYYHTRFDSWDNLDMDCISLTRDIIKEAVRLFDEGAR